MLTHTSTTTVAIEFDNQLITIKSTEKESSRRKHSKEHKRSKSKPKHIFVIFTNLPARNKPGRQWSHCDREKRDITDAEVEKQLLRNQEPGKDLSTLLSSMPSKQRRQLTDYEKRLNENENSEKYEWRIASLVQDKPSPQYDNVSQTMWAVYRREKNKKREKSRSKTSKAIEPAPLPRIETTPEVSYPQQPQQQQLIPAQIQVVPAPSSTSQGISIPEPQRPSLLTVPEVSHQQSYYPIVPTNQLQHTRVPLPVPNFPQNYCKIEDWLQDSSSDSSGSGSDNSSDTSRDDSSVISSVPSSQLRSILRKVPRVYDDFSSSSGSSESSSTSSSGSRSSSSDSRYPGQDYRETRLVARMSPVSSGYDTLSVHIDHGSRTGGTRRTRFSDKISFRTVDYEFEYEYESADESEAEWSRKQYSQHSEDHYAIPEMARRRDYDNAPLSLNKYVQYL